MTKHKTSELIGPRLDAAVAIAEGWAIWRHNWQGMGVVWQTGGKVRPTRAHFHPSTKWSDGGPIIDRERITVEAPCEVGTYATEWRALTEWCEPGGSTGPTPLIAAMRAYVASKLGDEVELPEGM